MRTFVSLLGLQPAATVAVVTTLVKQPGGPQSQLQRVVLLATDAVRRAGLVARVETALSHLDLRTEVRDLGDTGGANPLALMRALVADLATDAQQELVVHVDPGPQHLVIALVAALGPAAALVTTDIRHAIVSAEGQDVRRVPVLGIGVEALLALHDLPWTVSGRLSSAWTQLMGADAPPAAKGAHLGFRFDLPESQDVSFDIAYERGGHLFLLRAVKGGGTAAVRGTAATRVHLRGLRPVIGIVSDNPHTVGQARSLGMNGLHMTATGPRPNAIRRWIEGAAITPGSTLVMRTSEAQGVDCAPMRGAGGDGPDLACWLGTDASATLVSMVSHRPSRLWLLVDRTSAPIAETVRRLRAVMSLLPCGDVIVIASDTFGSDVRFRLAEFPEFASATASGSVVANLSPGRKVQGVALARVSDARLCTLDNRSGRVAWLDGKATPEVPLTGPAIVAAATVIGGPLRSECEAAAPDDAWGRLARALFDMGQERGVPSPVILFARKGRWIRIAKTGDVIEAVQRDGDWWLTLRDTKSRITAEASLGGDPRDGRWFEWLVATQFVHAGADEVRRNVAWAWTRKERGTGVVSIDHDWKFHRAEVDVVARFGSRFVVVSCKAGRFHEDGVDAAGNRPPTVDEALREIEAVAAMGFGRFALPALAVPRATATLQTRFRLHQGAAALDLSILHDAALLGRWVMAVADSRASR